MQAAGISHIGLVREKNEDKYIMDLQQKLFVICDGMGGHKGGKIASAMAAQVIERQYTSNDEQDRSVALNAAIIAANQKIWQVGSDNPEYQEMGTTATAAVIAGERLIVAHVGDSSLFLLRDGQIRKITTDHTSQKISANTIACYARAAPKGTENRIEKTPPDPQGQEAMSTAVPLLFLTQRAGNGAKPEGICIPLAPGRTFPSLPAGRLAVGGRPSLSGSDRVLFPFHTR